MAVIKIAGKEYEVAAKGVRPTKVWKDTHLAKFAEAGETLKKLVEGFNSETVLLDDNNMPTTNGVAMVEKLKPLLSLLWQSPELVADAVIDWDASLKRDADHLLDNGTTAEFVEAMAVILTECVFPFGQIAQTLKGFGESIQRGISTN